jgi:hypothetical protein
VPKRVLTLVAICCSAAAPAMSVARGQVPACRPHWVEQYAPTPVEAHAQKRTLEFRHWRRCTNGKPIPGTRFIVNGVFRNRSPTPTTQSQAQSRTSAPLAFDTSHLAEGVEHYRLVPLNGAVRVRTTAWTTTRRFVSHRGAQAVLQVSVFVSGDTASDTLLFDRQTLRPIWEHLHGPTTSLAAFDGRHATAQITPSGSGSHTVTLECNSWCLSGTIDETVAQSLPLRNGYRVVLPFFNGASIENDTLRVRNRVQLDIDGKARAAWPVDLAYENTVETLWIDPATRRILKHIYTSRKDHAQREVVMEPHGAGT